MAYNKTWDEPWKDGQTRRQFAVEKHNAGWDTRQIGDVIGKSHGTVWVTLSRMGLIESPSVVGATADDSPVDLKEIHRRLRALQAKTEAFQRMKGANSVTFPSLPVGIAVLSDQHMGGPAAYARMFDDADLVRDSGLYCVCAGDFLNNWSGTQKLSHLLAGEWLTQEESHALYRDYLDRLGSKLVAVVAGNHDNWGKKVGWDYVRESLKGKPVLFDSDQVDFSLNAGGLSKAVRLRHKFRGSSMYNPTHGIENACRLDGGSFDIGIAGHSHAASLAREFVVGGKQRLALLVASYKIADEYAVKGGFAPQFGTGSAAFIVDKDGRLHGYGDIRQAADVLAAMR